MALQVCEICLRTRRSCSVTDYTLIAGIGLTIARTLSINGAKAVYILGPVQAELDTAVGESPIPSNPFHPILCDITSDNDNKAAARYITSQSGYLNLLVSNAGVGGPTGPAGKLKMLSTEKTSGVITPSEYASIMSDVPASEFTKVSDINTTGTFYNILAFLPLLQAGNSSQNVASEHKHTSHILLTSSIAAITRNTMDFSPAYALSKAALLHLMKNLSTYSAQNNWDIRVNAILPGLMKSAITSSLPFMAGMNGKEVWEEGGVPKSVSPVGRLAGEEDIAGAVMYLCSNAGSFVNGVGLVVDGGRTGVVPATY